MLDSGWATARVAPTRASSPSCSRRGDACRRPRLSSPALAVAHAIAPVGRAVAHACRRLRYRARRARRRPHRFPDGLVGSVRTPQGRGTPPRTKGTKPCWIRDGRPRGSPLRGPRRRAVRVGATLVVAHACRRPRYRARRARRRPHRFPMASLGRYGTPQGRGTPPRTKGTKPCWIRDGRPQGSPLPASEPSSV